MRISFLLVLPFAILGFFLVDASSQPAPKPRFTDVTAASGLFIAKNTGVGGTNPHAVAIEDFDGDGLFDIIIPTFGKPYVRYFKNLGGLKFKDVTKNAGLERYEASGSGVA